MVDQKAWNRSKDSSKDKLILLQFQSLKEHGRSFFFNNKARQTKLQKGQEKGRGNRPPVQRQSADLGNQSKISSNSKLILLQIQSQKTWNHSKIS